MLQISEFLAPYAAQIPDAHVKFVWFAYVVASFFLIRVAFASACIFVRYLVIRNVRAFELLNGTVVFVRDDTDTRNARQQEISLGRSASWFWSVLLRYFHVAADRFLMTKAQSNKSAKLCSLSDALTAL